MCVLCISEAAATPRDVNIDAISPGFSSDSLSQEPTVTRLIKPGEVINAQIRPGENHRYSIELKAGEYLCATVERTGALNTVAFDPGGQPFAKINISGSELAEALWGTAGIDGTYEIRISTPTSGLTARQYTLKLEKVGDFQKASPVDTKYLDASGLIFRGDQLLGGDQESSKQAIRLLSEALNLWHEMGATAQEAYTLNQLGYAYGRVGEPSKSEECDVKAISLWEKLKRDLDEAVSLYNLSSVYMATERTGQAISSLQKSIALRRKAGEEMGLSYSLNNIGAAYLAMGEFDSALAAHKEALQLRRKLGDVEGEARSLSNVAAVYFRLGDYQTALDYSFQTLPLRRRAKDRSGEATTLINIGSTYRELGDAKEGLPYYDQAIAILHELSDVRARWVEASVLDRKGLSLYELGDYEQALQDFKQSLALKSGEELFERAAILAHIGNVYDKTGNEQDALEQFKQALDLQRRISDRRGQAMTLERTGQVYAKLGNGQTARQYFEQALAISKSINLRDHEASVLYDIARLEKQTGLIEEARSHVEDAIALVESARTAISISDLRASFLGRKQEFYELEIDLVMQSYYERKAPQDLIKGFMTNERRRARSLLDGLESDSLRPRVPADLALKEREARARSNQSVENQIKVLAGEHTVDQAAAAAADVQRAAMDYDQLLAQVRAADPVYKRVSTSLPLTFQDLQTKLLDPDTTLLEYSLGDERSYLWVVTANAIVGYQLPPRSEIEGQVRRVYDLLTTRNRPIRFEKPEERSVRISRADADYVPASGQLSRTIFGAVDPTLMHKKLVIVSDGALQYVPFAALPSLPTTANNDKGNAVGNYRPLVADFEITSLPSASILWSLREETNARKPPSKTVAVLADPVFSPNDSRVKRTHPVRNSERPNTGPPPMSNKDHFERATIDRSLENQLDLDRLSFTRQEANAILRLAPRQEEYSALDFDVNRATATNPLLANYRILHFATHGYISSAYPSLSGLVLSLVDRNGNVQNGFLSSSEILNLHLPADLVVLSGCRTGLGKEIRGEGILGLPRSFLYAGAARVAVSLWDVNDLSTADLMSAFYHGMLGKEKLSPAAALREAQIEMWKSQRWRAPYFWAAFTLQGEYR